MPPETEVRALLEFACDLGICYFDTAPSYGDGVSEERLGRFVKSLPAALRATITIATKMGEHWDRAKGEPYADHCFDALRRSLDRSIERLGRIDVLQLHKTTPDALRSGGVQNAWEYARSLGIARIGPSASDLESAALALEDPRFSVMQVPYHAAYPAFGPVIDRAVARGVSVVVNRPYGMGSLIAGGTDKQAAFRFVLARQPAVILTGTVSPDHLRENWEAFHLAAGE